MKFPDMKKRELSLPCSQGPTAGPYPETNEGSIFDRGEQLTLCSDCSTFRERVPGFYSFLGREGGGGLEVELRPLLAYSTSPG
jgi:hypothetical protein